MTNVLSKFNFRHSGMGVKFLNSIYKDLINDETIFDITGIAGIFIGSHRSQSFLSVS